MDEPEIRVVDSTLEFEQLEESWEALQAGAVRTSIFESFDWQYQWWKVYGRSGALRLLLATRGGTLVGILPLHIQTVSVMGYPVRVLQYVGYGGNTSPDDLGPVLAPGCEKVTGAAFARAVARLPGWDVLHLTDMNPSCPFTTALTTALRRRLLPCRTGRSDRIVFATLQAPWEEWLGTLHRDRRYRIRKARKRLHEAYPARFFVWDDAEHLDQAIDRLGHLHRKRWSASSAVSFGFSTPEYVQFHRSVMTACFRRDRLRLYCLELAGQIVAMAYFYKFRDRVFLMQSGFDPDFSDISPGRVLLGHIVEHAINEGNKVLDFLKGDHRYKEEIADGERETVFVTAFARRPGAVVYGGRRVLLPAMKARVLARTRPPAESVPPSVGRFGGAAAVPSTPFGQKTKPDRPTD